MGALGGTTKPAPRRPGGRTPGGRTALDEWLAKYSFPLLRISLGLVIFGFGFLKYFPGVSPAQDLVLHVNHVLTFGLVPDQVTLPLFATVESLLGLSLITGLGLRYLVYPLTVWAVAILSPLVLFPGELFSGPHHAPTLDGQYVIKDIILFAACLVVTARVRRDVRGVATADQD